MREAPIVLVALLLLGPTLPFMAVAVADADPWAPGPLAVATHDYAWGEFLLVEPTEPTAMRIEITGRAWVPAEGSGPFPVVVFQHGRHQTCEPTVFGALGHCPTTPLTTEVPSHLGYGYIAEHLASRGYVVLSVNANDVNDQDLAPDYGIRARAELVLRTLDEARALAAESDGTPLGDALEGRADLSRVGLMGHSRGGEGVARAAILNAERDVATRHAIGAVFALAPLYAYTEIVVDAPLAVLLPYCDGDLSDLQGAAMYDDARYGPGNAHGLVQILAMGSNHNYYNTVWTNDDWGAGGDYCNNEYHTRLSAEDQRRHGLVAIAGFLRLHLGPEPALAPLFLADAEPPAAACPAGASACDDVLKVSYHPPATARRVLESVADGVATGVNDLGGAATVTGFGHVEICAAADCPSQPVAGSADALLLRWNGTVAVYRLELPADARDASGYDALTMRAMRDFRDFQNNTRTRPVDLSVVLEDGSGTRVAKKLSAYSDALYDPPGNTDERKGVLNMAHFPLSDFTAGGVDTTDLRAVELVFDQQPKGSILVADILLALHDP